MRRHEIREGLYDAGPPPSVDGPGDTVIDTSRWTPSVSTTNLNVATSSVSLAVAVEGALSMSVSFQVRVGGSRATL